MWNRWIWTARSLLKYALASLREKGQYFTVLCIDIWCTFGILHLWYVRIWLFTESEKFCTFRKSVAWIKKWGRGTPTVELKTLSRTWLLHFVLWQNFKTLPSETGIGNSLCRQLVSSSLWMRAQHSVIFYHSTFTSLRMRWVGYPLELGVFQSLKVPDSRYMQDAISLLNKSPQLYY